MKRAMKRFYSIRNTFRKIQSRGTYVLLSLKNKLPGVVSLTKKLAFDFVLFFCTFNGFNASSIYSVLVFCNGVIWYIYRSLYLPYGILLCTEAHMEVLSVLSS